MEDEEEKPILLFDTDPFTFQTCFLSSISMILIANIYISNNFKLVFFFLLLIIIFYFLENSITRVIDDICKGSDYFKKSTLFLLPYSILSFLYCIILFSVSNKIITFSNDISFSSCFYSLVYFSLMIFSLSTSIKGLLVSLRIISDNYIRSGFFSMFQLFICFCRSSIAIKTWINWIRTKMQHYILSSFLYLIIKGYAIYLILYEISRSIKRFCQNTKLQFPAFQGTTDEECTICLCQINEPKILECGHIFCYNCINKWVKRRPICPLCRSKAYAPYSVDMMNGYIPFFILLCVF